MERDRAFDLRAEVAVPRFGAEMRQVDQRHGISCADANDGSGGKRQKPLPCAEHGEGAQQALAVDFDVPADHVRGVAVQHQRGKVAGMPRGCDVLSR